MHQGRDRYKKTTYTVHTVYERIRCRSHSTSHPFELMLAEHLVAADTNILQLWDVLLELPGCNLRVPRQPFLPLPDGFVKGDFGGSVGILVFLWNGGLWMCFDKGQSIQQALSLSFNLSLIFFSRIPAFQSSMAALLTASKNGFTPGGMRLSDWLLCDRDTLLYTFTKWTVFIIR